MNPNSPIKKFLNQLNTYGCAILLVLGIVVGLTAVIITLGRNAQAALPFKGMKDQVQAICLHCSGQPLNALEPHRRGRVLVVDSTGAAIGQVMANKRLAGIRATVPNEVGSIIFVGDKEEHQTGSYTDGSEAYRVYREGCIIDLVTGNVLYRGSIRGTPPPSTKSGAGPESGSDPLNAELIAFILALPEQ